MTRARSTTGGWYLLPHGRKMTTNEMLKVQGIVPGVASPDEYDIPERAFNAAIGNGMSVNVLERLLPRVAWAAGLLKRKVKDKWADPEFIIAGGRFNDEFNDGGDAFWCPPGDE